MNSRFVKLLVISFLIISVPATITAQRTASYSNPDAIYKSGIEMFSKQLFGPARTKFESVIQMISDPNAEMRVSAEYYQAICAVELFNDDAELLLNQFIENHPQSAHLRIIYFQLGKFQYRKNNYRSAIKSFEKADPQELSITEKAEYYFKLGYSYFERKQYEDAKKAFFQIIERENKYKGLANYYYAHIAYLDGNYETALKGFYSLKDDENLKPVIPYYITHIYYSQKKFNELLEVAVPLYEKSTQERKAEMARLIGEAYYHTLKYKDAIPYLETFYKSTSPTIQGYYQLGYAYYMNADYNSAIDMFKHIGIGFDSLSQNANYHLGLCYLKIDKKTYALNSFKYAADSKADPFITEDALYNYAKLSYELDFNPYNNAIKAFERYLNEYPKSAHRKEVMENLTKMYLSTKNYQQAKASIERINNRSEEMNAAYHRIIYAIGVQDFNNEKYEEAIVNFTSASTMRYTKSLVAPAKFWRAEALAQSGDIDNAIEGYKEFLASSGAIGLDYYNRAYYNLGYAYFSKKNYDEANVNFRIFIRNEKQTTSVIMNDAYLRSADCYFMKLAFNEAVDNYKAALAIGKTDPDYALYKMAEAYGVLNKPGDKVATFESLLKNYPKSTLAGNAELAMATTYFNSLNNTTKAIDIYKHIIETYPEQSNVVKKAMENLGLAYSNLDKNDEAIATWKKLIDNYRGTPEAISALTSLRNIYVSQNRVDEFIEYAKSLGFKPSVSQQDSITFMAAENVYMKGDCDLGSQGFIEYVNRFPAGFYIVDARFYLADCEFRASLFDKALEDYKFVVGMPVSAFTEKSWERLAYIYYHKKDDFANAFKAYTQLLKMAEYDKNIETAKIGIMRSLWNLGDTVNVIKAANDVLKISQLNASIRTEAMMLSAKSHLALKNDTAAMNLLNKIIKNSISEESAEARYIKAKYAFDKGDLNGSEAIIFEIIQQEPSYEYWIAKALILSADIFVLSDNIHQAIATLESIIEGYDGDKLLIEEAKAKLAAIKKAKDKQVDSLIQEPQMIIDLNNNLNDPDLFYTPEEESEDPNE